jgi:ketosteroid isomerase-like protein
MIERTSRFLLAVLLAGPVSARAAEVQAELTAEVHRGVTAYNAKDVAYYERVLDPQVTYVAEDGAVIASRDRVVALFKRIFDATPTRQLEVQDVVVSTRGEAAWALFRWTLTAGPDVRRGVATTHFARSDGAWKVVLIQNTPDGHGARPH